MRSSNRTVLAGITLSLLLVGSTGHADASLDAAPDGPLPSATSAEPTNLVPSRGGGIDPFLDGADHIIAQQCPDGGFGWPHDDCSETYNNITAPIGLGLLTAHHHRPDPAILAAAAAGGDFDLTHVFMNGEPQLHSFTGHFLYELSRATGDPVYADFARAFFDQLQLGTYGPDDFDTEGWIASIEERRTGANVNLRAWQFHLYVETAREIGHPGQSEAMVAAILRGLATLDNTDPDTVRNDVLGLAGAVKGLATANLQTFPPIVAPLHAGVDGIDNLSDLGQLLLSFQNPDGSWYRHSNFPAPTDTDKGAQNTAYSVLALAALDRVTDESLAEPIERGQAYLRSIQLPSGGFPSNPGGNENTEVEAEILWALGDGPAPLPVIEVPTLHPLGAVALALLLTLLAYSRLPRGRNS